MPSEKTSINYSECVVANNRYQEMYQLLNSHWVLLCKVSEKYNLNPASIFVYCYLKENPLQVIDKEEKERLCITNSTSRRDVVSLALEIFIDYEKKYLLHFQEHSAFKGDLFPSWLIDKLLDLFMFDVTPGKKDFCMEVGDVEITCGDCRSVEEYCL